MGAPIAPEELDALYEFLWPEDVSSAVRHDIRLVWFGQAFNFAEAEGCTLGFVQKKNGPCGVLAAVLGFLVRELFVDAGGQSLAGVDVRSLSLEARNALFARALAHLLWCVAEETARAERTERRDDSVAPLVRLALPSPDCPPVDLDTPRPSDDEDVPRGAPAGADFLGAVDFGALAASIDDPEIATLVASGDPATIAFLMDSGMLAAMPSVPLEASPATAGAAAADADAGRRSLRPSPLDPFAGHPERLFVHAFTEEAAVARAIADHRASFCGAGAPGAVLLLYSVVLTRGVRRAAHEARASDRLLRTLIYLDGTSEQAMLNLMLTGVARNGIGDSAWADWVRPPGRPEVGFLTDAEGYEAGELFVRPALPIWITHSGQHYTTTWATKASTSQVEDTPPVPPKPADPPAAPEAATTTTAAATTAAAPTAATETTTSTTTSTATTTSSPEDPSATDAGASTVPPTSSAGSAADTRPDAPPAEVHSGTEPGAETEGATAGAAAGGAGATADPPAATTPPVVVLPSEAPADVFFHFNGLRPVRAAGAPARLASFDLRLWGSWTPPPPPPPPPAGPETEIVTATTSTMPDGDPARADGAAGGGAPGAREPTAEERAAAERARELEVREAANKARKIKKVLMTKPLIPGLPKDESPLLYCVVCENDGSMEFSDEDRPPYEGRWYCRDCLASRTPNFAGYNEEGATVCKGCHKPARECRWAHWLTEDELANDVRETYLRDHAPPMLRVLRTRWPRAIAEWHGSPPATFG